jgi:hypothetical protein
MVLERLKGYPGEADLLGVAESRYETVIVMLNEVARGEASGEIFRSPL